MDYYSRKHKEKFIYRKKRLSERIKNGYRIVIVIVAVMSLFFSLSYLRLQTQNAVLGYYLSQLRSENDSLLSKNYKLTHKELMAQSMLHLEGETADLKMYAATKDNIAFTRTDLDIAVLPIFRKEVTEGL